MLKKLSAVFLAALLTLSLAACKKDANPTVASKDATVTNVSSNGGFLVETGDYVYFLNGKTDAGKYETGKVTKGALVRVKKTDIAKGAGAECNTIISKLLVADDTAAGVYLFDEYFYYAAPSTEKNSKGEVKTDKLLFFRTKADGSDTSKSICGKDFGSSVEYRYVSAGKNVYLIVKDSSDLYVYDAIGRKQLFKYSDSVSSIQKILFSSDVGDPALFYTIKPVNKTIYPDDNDSNRATENYYEVYSVNFGESKVEAKAERILDGIGKMTSGNTEKKGVYMTGATFDLIKYTQDTLYYSVTPIDKTASSMKTYKYMERSKFGEDNAVKYNDEAVTVLMNYDSDAVASSVFSDSALYLGSSEILYIDSSRLMLYDYTKNGEANLYYGAQTILDNEKISGATLDFVVKEGNDDYLYFHNGNVYYKVNYTLLKDGTHMDEEVFRINSFDVDNSWYKPEVVAFKVENETHYAFIAAYSDSSFLSYVYAVDTTKKAAEYAEHCETVDKDESIADKDKDSEKAKFYDAPEKDSKKYKIIYESLLGKMTSGNAKTVKDGMNKKD